MMQRLGFIGLICIGICISQVLTAIGNAPQVLTPTATRSLPADPDRLTIAVEAPADEVLPVFTSDVQRGDIVRAASGNEYQVTRRVWDRPAVGEVRLTVTLVFVRGAK